MDDRKKLPKNLEDIKKCHTFAIVILNTIFLP